MKNIRILAAAVALLMAVTTSQAQTWHLGAKAGLAASWMPGTEIFGYEKVVPHNSFYGGFLLDRDFGGWFYLQTELLFAGKGHSDKSKEDGKYKRQLNYLQLPVFFGLEVIPEQAYIMVGPEFGWLMSSKTKTGDLPKVNDTNNCHRFNLGLGIQMAYMISEELGVDLKFDWGLNRTLKKFKDVQDKGHNMSVQLGVCYKFEL